MAFREHTSTDAMIANAVHEARAASDEDLGSALALAAGMLLGMKAYGGAAAVASAFERIFPGNTLPYMPPVDPRAPNPDASPGATVEAAWGLVYGMIEAGENPKGKWWEQEFYHLRNLLRAKGYNCDPGE